MTEFDPNNVAVPNGNIFGFPVSEEQADIVLIPVPWDVTASYGKGTSKGPKAILDASVQLDFFHPKLKNAHLAKVFMFPISEDWNEINDKYCLESREYIDFLENGGVLSNSTHFKKIVAKINIGHRALKENLKAKAKTFIESGKTVAILGGEHSAPLGLIEALSDQHDSFGILQIDAHADLRDTYEGFDQSHASIMHNTLEYCSNITKLVQVGVRDLAPEEAASIENKQGRIKTFFDWDLKENSFKGITWSEQVKLIIEPLPTKVYISFDIDGLNPSLCPNTGTPVPGGFSLEEINYLLFALIDSGREVIGFDLCEVSPVSDNEWDANVGARVLWNLVVLMEKQRRNK